MIWNANDKEMEQEKTGAFDIGEVGLHTSYELDGRFG